MSKRERQKARRAARLEREARERAAAGRRRTIGIGLVVLLIVAAIGGILYVQQQQRAREAEQAEQVAARLDELGCTEDEEQPDLGAGHIPGDPAQLAAEAPEVLYDQRPPTSGRHIGQVAPSGVYDVFIDERFTTHNLEHGYVVMHYDPDAPQDQVDELKAWAEERTDDDNPKMIVAPAYFDIVDEANFAFTAWNFRQTCDTFDPEVGEVFLTRHYGTAGVAPEKDGTPNHVAGQQGVVDPEGEDLLLPPIAGASAEDVEEVEEATTPEGDVPDEPTPTETE